MFLFYSNTIKIENMKDISFLVPLYNEEKNIVLTVETIIQSALSQKIDYEIVITDDASKDQSFLVATNLATRFPQIKVFKNVKNQGFAKTYLKCLEMSDANYVMYISSDNDIDQENLSLLLSHFKEAPIILQYCLNPNERKYYRSLISKFYTKVLNFFNNKEIKYYNGFNIYQSTLVKSLSVQEESFAFQSEIVSSLIQKSSFVEVGIQCEFHDESSSALKIKNVFGVMKFLVKLIKNN